MGTRIYWIGGGKGGVGKSMVSMALVDYLGVQGVPLFLVDSDTSNPDVYKSYREAVPCELLDLDKVDGWIHLVNLCDTHREKIIVVNTAARSNSAVTKFGGTLSTSLQERPLPRRWGNTLLPELLGGGRFKVRRVCIGESVATMCYASCSECP